ncbi:peripheral-type benzodiazepine receptor-associated 1-like isoform X1 [Pelobates cultripes]|uniref:Peripheral-type benzodiazepine receptor-associated 1-like isoform X1 n=1 Tax=Pelobates cultripes TaxID=61616 RepID=A0AAD1QZS6_PELCU|nr:peripheral-type benzodiazepine receptor-associated 1-like isoform X1 [Pelobates cultripes]
MLCMSANGQHSTMNRASESSEEPWVLEAVARCSLVHSPLLAGAVKVQESDACAHKELSNGVVPVLMSPAAPLMDIEHPVMQVLKHACQLEPLTGTDNSVLEFKASELSGKNSSAEPLIVSIDGHEHAILAGNLSAVSAGLDVAVSKLARTKLQGIKCVSVPTDKQEVPVCPQENGIRPNGTEYVQKPIDTVCVKDDNYMRTIPNGSDPFQPKQDAELLNKVQVLERRCNELKAENISLRKNIFPETEEKVKRLKRKNAELAVVAKRLEERAHKLQEANLKMVSTPMHLRGTNMDVYKKEFARQRAKDLSEQASALLAKDKQIESLKQECHELQAKISSGKDVTSWLKLSDLDRLLHESQKEVLRLQRQIAIKHFNESLHLSRSDSQSSQPPHPDAVYIESLSNSDQLMECENQSMKTTSGDGIKESELTKKRKECDILEQEVKKKQKRCEELEFKLQEVQTENARLVEENSRLSGKVKQTVKVEAENADLREYLNEVTEQRDSALKENHHLQSKLENLEEVLKHMRDVVERRQQLEKDHEDALTALKKRQEEVKRLQQAQVEAKKEHEGAVQLLEVQVKILEEKCRSQTEQFSLLSQELERFRLQTGNIDLLTSTLVTSELPPPQCCSTPGLSPVHDERQADCVGPDLSEINTKINEEESKKEETLPPLPDPHCESQTAEAHDVLAKEKEKLEAPQTLSKSESMHESSKSCPTPEVDTASEMEELEADSISLNPDPEARTTAKLQVFIARYSYNPFDGPNENPEAELPLTAGEYIYVYGDMDDDGFYEGELMDGRRGLVPSNFVERVSDDGLMAFQPPESNELSQSSGQDISFLSGSSIERSEEDDDGSSLSPLPCIMQGNNEGNADVSTVPYPRKLALIKQLARSVVVGWEPPLVKAGSANILSYNIYVDNELRQNVRCGGQTKALIEKLELKTQNYRISVQSMTERGCSDRMRCTMLVGHGFSLAPTQLRVRSLSATYAEVTWQPCNSNYSHALYLNEEICGRAKTGTYWYSFSSLRPCTTYNVKVEAQPQRIPWEMPLERREQKTTVLQLTTPPAGPPDAPLDVQVELGPTAGVLLISWLPVTIDAAGTSNGTRVTGYAVYADGQKVLEVTSPTAGSVLVGMSHLQLLQVSREISVRTMFPGGESMDSVPAQIPSALLMVSDRSLSLHTLSNTSLICQPSSGSSMNTSSETFPSIPLSMSSPCSLTYPHTTSSKANFSIHASCRSGEAIDPLPVRISPHLLLSPHSASLSFCQGSSRPEPSKTLVPQQGSQEKKSSIQPQLTTNYVPPSLPIPAWTSENVEMGNITLQEEKGRLQTESPLKDTKEPELNDPSLPSGLPLEPGKAWNTESMVEKSTVTAKEECSSPETVLSEEAEDTSCRVGYRDVSIEDFLKEEKLKESEATDFNSEAKEVHVLQPDVVHATVSHSDLSRCSNLSNLSDILEEEEEDEEEEEEEEEEDKEDNNCNIVKKWGHAIVQSGDDSSTKLDTCETDSDEEILERMLDLPLQKHCSKKLFSIPEVTEEEDEEEENLSPPVSLKMQSCCSVGAQKYQNRNTPETIPPKSVNESCKSWSTENCQKDYLAKCTHAHFLEEDCVDVDHDWCLKTKESTFQFDGPKPCLSGSAMLNAKRSSSQNDRAHYWSESSKKRLGDTREHCSRLVPNSTQAGLNSRGHPQKDQAAYGIPKELSSNNHKSCKGKTRKYSERQSLKAKIPSSCNSRNFEIDVEYDTEDEDEPPFPSPAHSMNQNETDLWQYSSKADHEASRHSEPIRNIQQKALKRQFKVQNKAVECLKGTSALLPGREIPGPKFDRGKDNPDCRIQSNKTVRITAWDCGGKVDWNGEPKASNQPGLSEVSAPVRTRASPRVRDSETGSDHCASPEFFQKNSPQEKDFSLKRNTVRMFVARFDYEPATMSPNPDAYEEELPFKEGQILQVFGDKDADGFYRGECAGKTGYIPCNMVSELHIQNEDMRVELVRKGHLQFASLQNNFGQLISNPEEKHVPEKSQKTNKTDLSNSRRMVAIFDYNPKESSPNVDIEAELSFTAGDNITIYGAMDEDGFYYGELNGQRGLVPSNFLAPSPSEEEKAKSQEQLNSSVDLKRLRRRTK